MKLVTLMGLVASGKGMFTVNMEIGRGGEGRLCLDRLYPPIYTFNMETVDWRGFQLSVWRFFPDVTEISPANLTKSLVICHLEEVS